MQFWHCIYISAVAGVFTEGYRRGNTRGLPNGWQCCVSICEAVWSESPDGEDTGDCWRRTIMTQRASMETETSNAALASLQMHRASPKVIKNTPETDKVFKEFICFFFPPFHSLSDTDLWLFPLSSWSTSHWYFLTCHLLIIPTKKSCFGTRSDLIWK